MADTTFAADLGIIDGNPFVTPPNEVLETVFAAAGRRKGPIPVRGTVNGRALRQTLVRFRSEWRLYVNLMMLDDSPRRVGERIEVTLGHDPGDRSIPTHPRLVAMLDAEPRAKAVFDGLSPSRRKEIVRYIDALKTEPSVERNVERARRFLLGEGRFVGRDTP